MSEIDGPLGCHAEHRDCQAWSVVVRGGDFGVKVVSWNVAYRVGAAAKAQGDWLAALRPLPTLAILQEVNPNSIDALCEAAGFTWWQRAVDLRKPEKDDRPRTGPAPAGGAGWPTPHRPSQRYKSWAVSYLEVVHAQALCEGVPPGPGTGSPRPATARSTHSST